MRIILFFLLVTSWPCVAQVYYGTPDEINASVRNQQLGDAAYAIGRARALSVQRQKKIVDLRNSIARCGNCTSLSDLKSQLDVFEREELKTLHAVDGTGNRNFRDVLLAIIDPMHLRDEEYNKKLIIETRENERRNFLFKLRNNYCYASTSNPDEQLKCLSNLNLSDFADNEIEVITQCASYDRNDCIEKIPW